MKPDSKNRLDSQKFQNLALDLGRRAVESLTQKGLKIGIAESCTGGLLAYHFTANAGASNVLDGAMISYANAIKSQWLGVSEEDLARYGAVSAPVVEQMCQGILERSGADIALATSGIAGPGGGSEEKKVGSVYIGLLAREGVQERLREGLCKGLQGGLCGGGLAPHSNALQSSGHKRIELCHFDGNRHEVQIHACKYALCMLLEFLEGRQERKREEGEKERGQFFRI